MLTSHFLLASIVFTTVLGFSTYPLVFFAFRNNTFVPLTTKTVWINKWHMNAFTYTNPGETPLEFDYENGHAVTKNTIPPAYAKIIQEKSAFGIDAQGTQLDVSTERKIENIQFYTCNDPALPKDIIISSPFLSVSCKQVDIYLMHYDPFTKAPVMELPVPEQYFDYQIDGAPPKDPPASYVPQRDEDLEPEMAYMPLNSNELESEEFEEQRADDQSWLNHLHHIF